MKPTPLITSIILSFYLSWFPETSCLLLLPTSIISSLWLSVSPTLFSILTSFSKNLFPFSPWRGWANQGGYGGGQIQKAMVIWALFIYLFIWKGLFFPKFAGLSWSFVEVCLELLLKVIGALIVVIWERKIRAVNKIKKKWQCPSTTFIRWTSVGKGNLKQ